MADVFIVHLVMPAESDALPDELASAVQVRRELYETGTCSTCCHTLPTGEQMRKFRKSTQDVLDQRMRSGIISTYFDHLDWCRGSAKRVAAIAKRNGGLEQLDHEIASFDLEGRRLVETTPIPEGVSPEDVAAAYRRIAQEGRR